MRFEKAWSSATRRCRFLEVYDCLIALPIDNCSCRFGARDAARISGRAVRRDASEPGGASIHAFNSVVATGIGISDCSASAKSDAGDPAGDIAGEAWSG